MVHHILTVDITNMEIIFLNQKQNIAEFLEFVFEKNVSLKYFICRSFNGGDRKILKVQI